MSNPKAALQKPLLFLALSVLLNAVLIYRAISTHQETPQSINPTDRLAIEKSPEQGAVFRDANDVLHVTGRLTTSVGEQVMRSIKEGVRRIELDLVGGELSQAIRVSELLRQYRYPVSVKNCKGSCLAIWLTSSNEAQTISWEQERNADVEMTGSEWALLQSYLIFRGVNIG
jgi:hypothetical protein